MEDKKVTDEINLGNGYTDDTLMRVVESDADYKQRYGDLKTYIFSTNAISIAWADFADAFTGGKLEPGRIYSIDMATTGVNGQLFIQVDFLGIFDPVGTMIYPSSGNTKLLKVELAVDENGFASYIFNYFHDPISNNTWYGHPDNHGDNGRAFFNYMMSQSDIGDANIDNTTVTFNAYFYDGFPDTCHNWVWNSGNFYFSFPNQGGFSDGSTMAAVTLSFSQNPLNISSGVVGGRGCTANNDQVYNLSGSDFLDLDANPICKVQTIQNVDITGLKSLTGWDNYSINFGATILVYGTYTIAASSTGNIIFSQIIQGLFGALPINVNKWAQFLLSVDGNAYLINYE